MEMGVSSGDSGIGELKLSSVTSEFNVIRGPISSGTGMGALMSSFLENGLPKMFLETDKMEIGASSGEIGSEDFECSSARGELNFIRVSASSGTEIGSINAFIFENFMPKLLLETDDMEIVQDDVAKNADEMKKIGFIVDINPKICLEFLETDE